MRCAVLGSPIVHSLSPVMHRAAYAELGLDWTYDALEVTEEGLELFLASLGDDVRGLSVTAPLKRRLAQLVPVQTADVSALGVANTVIVEDGQLRLHNTDVPGAVSALLERGIDSVSTARILGGGATAASMAYALSTVGAEHVQFVVRDPARAAAAVEVAAAVGVVTRVHTMDEPLGGPVDLLVSTVPADAVGPRSALWNCAELVTAARAVFDVIYDPWPTPLANASAERAVPFVSGLDLLAHQAALQVEVMTGEWVCPQLLRDAALAELTAR